jgi:2-hydroxychromene-2-carboxylate isomerase
LPIAERAAVVTLKSFVVPRIAAWVTGERRLQRRRAMQESRRKAASAPHVVDYFHDVTDPYSHLAAQVLDAFAACYDIRLDVHLVSPPPDWAAPERARLEDYSRLDAARLAQKAGLSFTDPGRQPEPAQAQLAAAFLGEAIDAGTFASAATAAGGRDR